MRGRTIIITLMVSTGGRRLTVTHLSLVSAAQPVAAIAPASHEKADPPRVFSPSHPPNIQLTRPPNFRLTPVILEAGIVRNVASRPRYWLVPQEGDQLNSSALNRPPHLRSLLDRPAVMAPFVVHGTCSAVQLPATISLPDHPSPPTCSLTCLRPPPLPQGGWR
ncbi:hypothetical protein LX32DRAFT_333722 [Colletotrichum zoysiae]|uniref:Uncharacterized protein n=1 Tax=Colletotrichum zoysiae TaxID=1216348 RepID=A0AAD9HJE0_9PEZI|nr:hypothetical protein LX32DRAFT_333722 [Colletotrichum zoysiae]